MTKYSQTVLYILLFVSCSILKSNGEASKTVFSKQTKYLKTDHEQTHSRHVLNSHNSSRKLRNFIQDNYTITDDKQIIQNNEPSNNFTVHKITKLLLETDEDKLFCEYFSR